MTILSPAHTSYQVFKALLPGLSHHYPILALPRQRTQTARLLTATKREFFIQSHEERSR